jgi:hypothetical protein
MTRRWPALRFVALLAAGSVMVHELRYMAGYGEEANTVMVQQGHSFMPLLEALAAVLIVFAGVCFALSLVRANRDATPAQESPGFLPLWLSASAALGAVYTLQEGIEGAFAPGHPEGLIGVFGNGGWTAFLLALGIGALIGFLLRGAQRVIELVARRAATRPRRSRSYRSYRPRQTPSFGNRDVLARNLAGRAPPLAS